MPFLNRRSRRIALGFLLAPLLLPAAQAQSEMSIAGNPLLVSGFMTLGLAHNNNAQAGVVSSSVQKHPLNKGWGGVLDTVAGVQLNWQPIDSTSFVLQGVVRAGDAFAPKIRLATVRQQLTPALALRLGRLRSPLFFDSDVSEIGYAYLSVRPSLPLYASLNSVAHVDGGDIQWRSQLGDMNLLVQGFAGKSEYRHRFYSYDPIMVAKAKLDDLLGLAVSITARASHTSVGSYAMRADQLDALGAGTALLAQGVAMMALDPRLPAPLAAGLGQKAARIGQFSNIFDGKPTYTSLGFDGSFGDWRVLGEVTRFKSRSEAIGDYAGWQLTLGHSFGEFTPYVGASAYRRLTPLLDTSALAPTVFPLRLGQAELRVSVPAGIDTARIQLSPTS